MAAQGHLLVVGSGSVGRRHLRNFAALGCDVSAFDPRTDRLAEAAKEVPLRYSISDPAEIEAKLKEFSGVAVCSPTKFHVDQCLLALQAGVPVLLEKPVSRDLESAQTLQKAVQASKAPLLLGYTYRWWQPLNEMRDRVRRGDIGTPLHVRGMMSAHLADWHPWEHYQDWFMSSRDLGGGALLDESHMIDLMYSFFGLPESVFARVETISKLGIQSDDNVDLWLKYADSLRVTIHLDLYGRPHRRELTIVGDQGTLHWTYDPNRLRFSGVAEDKWEDTSFTTERNDMFMAVAREFLAVAAGQQAPSCTIEDGVKVMAIIEAARRSSDQGALQVVTI